MAGIAQSVQLYNSAYKLAWKYISEDQKREQPNIARYLHDSIRRRLKEGATEAVFIASDALEDVEKTSVSSEAVPVDSDLSPYRELAKTAVGGRHEDPAPAHARSHGNVPARRPNAK